MMDGRVCMTIHQRSSNHMGKPTKMISGTTMVPMRDGGHGIPPGAGRADTVQRFAVKTAGQCGRNVGPAKVEGEGDGGICHITRNLRKFEHVASIVGKFIKTGTTEPRRVRSVPIVDLVREPYLNKNTKYAHVTSPVSIFMRTGIREPRRVRSTPVVEQVRERFENRNRRYAHVKSTIQAFMKTGIREPRRLVSMPSQADILPLPKPSRKGNKRYQHVKSRVSTYVRKPTKGQLKTELEWPESIELTNPPDEFHKIESIANPEIPFRDVKNDQSKLMSEIKSKYPFYYRLVNCRDRQDQFNLVLALGLGYVLAWVMLFYLNANE